MVCDLKIHHDSRLRTDVQFIAELNSFFEVVGNCIGERVDILKFVVTPFWAHFRFVMNHQDTQATWRLRLHGFLNNWKPSTRGALKTISAHFAAVLGYMQAWSLGNIGTPSRLDFAVGETVNIASRIEALCKPEILFVGLTLVAEQCSVPLVFIGTFQLEGTNKE